MSTHDQPDIHEVFAELTRDHQHREPYSVRIGTTWWRRHHRTQVPSLVHQLLGATPGGTTELSGATPTSRPAARIEAVDTLMLLDDEAGEWIDRLGGVIPSDAIDRQTHLIIRGTGTIARLQRLHGLLASTTTCGKLRGHRDDSGAWCCQRHHLEHDVRRWWHQARIITGWDSPAYRPFNTCPICDHRGGLRVKPDAAMCIECRSVWVGDQLTFLALHIRTENGDVESA